MSDDARTFMRRGLAQTSSVVSMATRMGRAALLLVQLAAIFAVSATAQEDPFAGFIADVANAHANVPGAPSDRVCLWPGGR